MIGRLTRNILLGVVLVVALVVAPAADPAEAQQCALVGGTGVELAAGGAAYEVAGGLAGPTLGAGAALALSAAALRADYTHVYLDGPDPRIVRLTGAIPLPLPLPRSAGGLALCAVAHGGAALLAVDRETSSVLAGGAGLRLVHPFALGVVRARSYAEARGLWGKAGGRLLGVELGGSGIALGGEVGVRASVGRFTVALMGSLDGFSEGLGLTPYPTRALRAGAGVRF